MTTWIKCSERLPDRCKHYWTICEGDAAVEMEKRIFDGASWIYDDGSECPGTVTHWMPMPPSPTDTEESK